MSKVKEFSRSQAINNVACRPILQKWYYLETVLDRNVVTVDHEQKMIYILFSISNCDVDVLWCTHLLIASFFRRDVS